MDTLDLSRIQFAANITFHILFPAISIGLAWFLVYFRWRARHDDQDVWMRCYRFWVKLFALTFALGVVSGVTMSFQFGTNWPGFMERVGNIAGPLLGYEVLTAFFMEATFLGIMLFGIHRVAPWVHITSTVCVAVGTTLSAFWIIALNSWMHTPAGFEMRDGVVFPASWWEIVFNPSMPYRLAHVTLASGLTAAFLITGISAYRMVKGDPKPAPRLALRTALTVAAILAPLQILSGDLHGLNTREHQPAKIAAMEALWETGRRVPFVIAAWPDADARTNRWALEIPAGASLVLTHDAEGVVQGLDEFEHHPPVAPVFFAFRIMLAAGMAMLICAWWGAYRLWRHGTLGTSALRVLVGMTFSGWVGTLAGWYVTEIGRQPYLVSGILTTAEAVTTQPAAHVALSLAGYLLLYAFLLITYVATLFYLARKSADLERDHYETGSIDTTPGHFRHTPAADR